MMTERKIIIARIKTKKMSQYVTKIRFYLHKRIVYDI